MEKCSDNRHVGENEFLSLSDATQSAEWDAFVEQQEQSTPFHLSGWLRAIERTFKFRNASLMTRNSKGAIVAIFPAFALSRFGRGRRLLSLPFSDYGGPILCEGSCVDGNTLLRQLRKKVSPAKVEIRNAGPIEKDFTVMNYYKYHRLRLNEGPDKIWKALDKRTIQYSIRKARKNGVEVKECNNPEGMAHFQKLHFLTRKKHGVPSQPNQFFTEIYNNLIARGYGYLLVAFYQKLPVAASLFLKTGNGVFYKYNASDPDLIRKVTPNHLLTWSAIEKAKQEGYQFLDFGRTSPNNKGLMRYKENWGATVYDLPYVFWPEVQGTSAVQEDSRLYKMVTAAWKKMPNWIAEPLGTWLYRHLA
jgi:hypothetical protein